MHSFISAKSGKIRVVFGMILLFIIFWNYDTIINRTYRLQVPESSGSRYRCHQQEERKKILREACNNSSLTYNYGNIIKSMHVDHKDQILYCDIPKVGCTFLIRLLVTLDSKGHFKSPFDITPNNVHLMKLKRISNLQEPNKSLIEMNYKTFLFVRDPYKRLFSGYVDKIFTPQPSVFLLRARRHTIRKFRKNPSEKSLRCAHDVTFVEFVSYVMDSIENRTMNNIHFDPMYKRCAPCDINYDIIGHLETIQEDLQHLINPERLEAVLPKDLRMSSQKDEIYDAMDIAFRNMKSNRSCLSAYEMFERIWRRLQIRGILSRNFNFPLSPKISETLGRDGFYKILETYLNKSRMEPSTASNKREATAEAFSTIPLKMMEKLQTILEMDCKLFGYDSRPDYAFNAKLYVNENFKYFVKN